MAVLENVTVIRPFAGVEVQYTLYYILLSMILGIIGQFIRVGVGLKKTYEESGEFDTNKLIGSLVIAAFVGGTAGVLYIIAYWDKIYTIEAINQSFLLTLMSVGYAGTDFIEGIMKREPTSIKWTTAEAVQQNCMEDLAAIEAGKKDTNVLKMEVVRKV
jgi:hypothetical protein